MKIQSITEFGRRKRKILLDSGETFPLSVRDVRLFSLREEADIDDLTAEQIRKQLRSDCMQRCGALLGTRDYTEARLTDKLREDLYPEETIRTVVRELLDAGYLDDARYAAYYLQMHAGDRSRIRIRHDLLSRGVPAEVIERVMGLEEPEDALDRETAQIRRLLKKWGYDPQDGDLQTEQKIRNRLYRKGYSGEAVRCAMAFRGDAEVDNLTPHV